MIRLATYWANLALGIGTTLLGPALAQVLAGYHLPPSAAGLLFAAATPGYIAAVLLAGPIGDAVGRRPVLLAGAMLFLLGLAAFALAPGWWVAVLAQAVIGLANGVIDSAVCALVNDAAAPGRHAAEQNLLHACFGLGAIAGPLLVGWSLAGGYGWRPAFGAGAAIAGALALLAIRVRAPQPRATEGAAVGRGTLALARHPLVLALGLVLGLYIGEETVVGGWSATYLQQAAGLGADAAAGCVGLFWAGLAGGRLLAVLLSRRLSACRLLVSGAGLSLLGTLLLVAAPAAPATLAALLLCGLGFAPMFPLVMALSGEWFPHAAGSAAGLLIATGVAVGGLLAMGAGLLVGACDVRTALATCPGCAAVILCLAVAIERRFKDEAAVCAPRRGARRPSATVAGLA